MFRYRVSKRPSPRKQGKGLLRLPFRPQRPLVCTFASLGIGEIRKAYEPLIAEYPPVLNLKQAAALAHMAPGTLKRKVSEGGFKKSVKRGKPLLFWRDLFVQEVMK